MNAIVEQESGAPVDWRPIEAVPIDRKDGRDVLLWAGHPEVCLWCDGWRDPVGRLVAGATHYADLGGPAS